MVTMVSMVLQLLTYSYLLYILNKIYNFKPYTTIYPTPGKPYTQPYTQPYPETILKNRKSAQQRGIK